MKLLRISKLLAVAVVALLCMPAFYACGDDEPAATPAAKPTVTPTPSEPSGSDDDADDPSEPSEPTDPTVHVTNVTISPSSIELKEGESQTLTVTITPANATNKAYSWVSDNEDVATIDAQNKVTAHYMGTAILTLTTADAGRKAMCIVTVTNNGGTGVTLPDNYPETIIDNSSK